MSLTHLNRKLLRFFASVAFLAALTGCAATNEQAPDRQTVKVKIIALNDLHGYLIRAENAEVNLVDPDAPKGVARVQVGGISYIASLVKKLKAENPNSIFVGVGGSDWRFTSHFIVHSA